MQNGLRVHVSRFNIIFTEGSDYLPGLVPQDFHIFLKLRQISRRPAPLAQLAELFLIKPVRRADCRSDPRPLFDRHRVGTIIDITSESLSTLVRNRYRHRPESAPIHLNRALHIQSLVRAFIVEILNERISSRHKNATVPSAPNSSAASPSDKMSKRADYSLDAEGLGEAVRSDTAAICTRGVGAAAR